MATGVNKLFVTEQKLYVVCSSDGKVDFVKNADDVNAEWIMEKPSYQEGGSVFRSKVHNLYLSIEETTVETETEGTGESTPNSEGRFSNLFGGSKEKVAKLVGSETMGLTEVWRLEPCMPRAVSSEKIKTFALGTSIAVGTTIAVPFALAASRLRRRPSQPSTHSSSLPEALGMSRIDR